MVLSVLLVKDLNDGRPPGRSETIDHHIPLQNVDSYGKFSDIGVGQNDTLLIMKSGLRYRLRIHHHEFDHVYREWQKEAVIYINTN